MIRRASLQAMSSRGEHGESGIMNRAWPRRARGVMLFMLGPDEAFSIQDVSQSVRAPWLTALVQLTAVGSR